MNEGKILKGLFGDELFMKAQTQQSNMLESYRKNNQLGMDRASGILGTIGAGTTALKTNTFFGQNEIFKA